jgi:DNA processing protein
VRACADCIRDAQLLRELTPRLDRPATGRPPLLLAMDPEALAAAVNGPGAARARTLDRSDDDLLSGAEREHRELGVESVCRHDPDYPARLRDLPDPPSVLHVLGGVERLHRVMGPAGDRPAVAMVGARKAPGDARRVARRFAEAVAGAGITVVSGMAFGIDEAAHEGALAAGPPDPGVAFGPRPGGTVAVLAAGVERPTPATLRALHERIGRDGVVVGELPPGSSPRRWSFPARNRLIAALSDGLVVVAAARGSGSLTSVGHARTLGRPVGVVPGSVLDPAYAGGNDVLRGRDLLRLGEDGAEDPGIVRVIVEPDDVRLLLRAPQLRLHFGPGLGGEGAEEDGRTASGRRPLLARSAGPAPGAGGARATGSTAAAPAAGTIPRRPDATDEHRAPGGTLEHEIAPHDPLLGLEGRARQIAERLVHGPRTIESLIAEADPATILAGLGALEAGGRLRRSLNGDLELLVERPGPEPAR